MLSAFSAGAAAMRMGMAELGIILAILVLLFGAKRLPQLADGVGKAIRNFKRGLNAEDEADVTPPEKQVADASSARPLHGSAADAGQPEAKA
jgi:sec-independent protein translocase protein TatA